MKVFLAISSAIVLLPQSASAEWVRAKGSYIFPPVIAEADACRQADARARLDAVRQVSGETFSSEEAMRCSEHGDDVECARNSTIWTLVGGEIRSTRNRRSKTAVEVDSENIKKCIVTFEADVHVAQGILIQRDNQGA